MSASVSATPVRLFTPGPLNTSESVRQAATQDLGSRTPEASALTHSLCQALLELAGCDNRWCATPLQGSGTFAVEAMLTSLLAPDDQLLIIENGVYSARMADICQHQGINHSVLSLPSQRGFDLEIISETVAQRPGITHLAAVHFETGLGVLNDINALLHLAETLGCAVLVDAISTFGVLPIDYQSPALVAVAVSANKCLHGIPGVAFVLSQTAALNRDIPPRSLSLDLQAQARILAHSGQWRFTPPLQVMRALQQAVTEYQEQGGQAARHRCYQARMTHLLKGMQALGFEPVIEPQYRAPLIVTLAPSSGRQVNIQELNAFLLDRQLVIYPSQLSTPHSFRVGVMGELTMKNLDELLEAFQLYLDEALTRQSPQSPSQEIPQCP
ncbi:2-aminoethylphosphonate--pyruvate transaminase [Spartinivicinus poritis]|uniref:2-aminoethylphosphonate--pyruvate transaminase n=1 Tax=Spartinivicinus poritis TaxID=2994640 RepID=A0ABT5U7W0_9GAMM|nr:2-aminoethylphosphonate--pyruvate transaminase [Spartinivicinus sp. A2-2]MDE1462455.1 2-aminoethylphosphonate--pyruvate transaminase [Spartinivicinus sp. A2-2]